MSSLLKQIQNQPVAIKKAILWVTVAIFGICLFVFWAINFQKKIKELQKGKIFEGIKPPSFDRGIQENYDDIKEEFENLENLIKEAEKTATSTATSVEYK